MLTVNRVNPIQAMDLWREVGCVWRFFLRTRWDVPSIPGPNWFLRWDPPKKWADGL